MRKFTLLLLLVSLPTLLYGEVKKDKMFTTLQVTYFTANYADLLMSNYLLTTDRAVESNPVSKFYVEHLELAIPITTVVNLATYSLTNWLYKQNKTVAYISLIVLNLAKGFAIYTASRLLDN